MFTNYMKYRKDNNVDSILKDFQFNEKLEVYQNYTRGYCGVDKIGRPIYIEMTGQMNASKMWECTT